MSFDSLYNSNPSLRLKILQDLVDEYKSFIVGAKTENSLGIFGSQKVQDAYNSLKNTGLAAKAEGDSKSQIEDIQKAYVNKFTFSSNGCYQIHDLLGNLTIFNNLPKNTNPGNKTAADQSIDDAIVVLLENDIKHAHLSGIILKEQDALYNSEYSQAYFAEKNIENNQAAKIEAFQKAAEPNASMKRMCAKVTFEDKVLDKRRFELLEKENADEAKSIYNDYKIQKESFQEIEDLKLLSQGKTPPERKEYTLSRFKDETLPINAPQKQMKDYNFEYINKSVNEPSETQPSMSAIVIKKPGVSINARNDNFLSIFFGAITPLELSRCTPYLSLTFFNEAKTGDKVPYREYLDNIAYMKFTGGKDGVFSKSGGLGAAAKIPSFSKTDISKDRRGPVGHMDIFTSPQTMVNANINKTDQLSPKSLHSQQLDNVLDPFAPMLSLGNFSITVQGGQYYLVTNRRAQLSVILHDRSRLADIAPFISLNEVARTIIKVEHGWSHPEGDIVRSKNPVGRFLNSMRESMYYRLTSSDFSFNGNSVTINMTLDFFGFTDFEDAHVSFGAKTSLSSSTLSKYLAYAFDNFFENQEVTIPKSEKELSAEQKEEFKKASKKMQNVIKSIKILRGHSQNSTTAVDTVKAQELKTWIDNNINHEIGLVSQSAEAGALQKKQLKTDFMNKFFDLLDCKSAFNMPEDANASWELIQEKLSNEGFSDELTEHLRFNFASEVMQKIERLTGYNYDITVKNNPKKKAIDTSPDPVQTQKEIEKKAEEEKNKKPQEKEKKKQTERILEITEGKNFTITPDYFRSKRCCISGVSASSFESDTMSLDRHTSLGKLICGMIGLPAIAGNSNYTELQIFFYPINNQAGGARKYTTASLPVDNEELIRQIDKAIKNNYDLTLKSFFEILSNIFSENDDLKVYGLSQKSQIDTIEKEVNKKLEADKAKNNKGAFGIFSNKVGRDPSTQKERDAAYTMYKKLLYDYYRNSRKDGIKESLKKIYTEDELGPAPIDKFLKPILQMEIESLPAIIPKDSNALSSDSLLDLYAQEFKYNFLDNEKDMSKLTGIDNSKKILRIHIFDSNATQKPFEKIAMESAIEFDKFLPMAGRLKDENDVGNLDLNKVIDKDTKKTLGDRIKEDKKTLISYFEKLTHNELKQYMLRSFPTIRYGSQVAVVKQISVRSNTTDSIINARLMNEIKKDEDKKAANVKKGITVKEDFTTFVIPTSVDITLYGCPFITVGNCIYLDLGTGTDIDNIYMVTDVTHNIGKGEYSTSITVAMPAQGTVKSAKSRLVDMVKLIPSE